MFANCGDALSSSVPSGRILFWSPRSRSAKSAMPEESSRTAAQLLFIPCGGLNAISLHSAAISFHPLRGLKYNSPPLRSTIHDVNYISNLESLEHRARDTRFVQQLGNVNKASELEASSHPSEIADFSREPLLVLNPVHI